MEGLLLYYSWRSSKRPGSYLCLGRQKHTPSYLYCHKLKISQTHWSNSVDRFMQQVQSISSARHLLHVSLCLCTFQRTTLHDTTRLDEPYCRFNYPRTTVMENTLPDWATLAFARILSGSGGQAGMQCLEPNGLSLLRPVTGPARRMESPGWLCWQQTPCGPSSGPLPAV